MYVRELIKQVRVTLQDSDKIRWSDEELLDYYNNCKFAMASERLEDKTYGTVTLDPLKTDYSTTGVLRYVSVKDDEGNERKLYPDDGTGDDDSTGIIVRNYNWIIVNDPTIGTSLRMQIIAIPDKHTLDSAVRLGDEEAYRYYILSKSYEKESDTENFGKVEAFHSKYLRALDNLVEGASVRYAFAQTPTTKSYFF